MTITEPIMRKQALFHLHHLCYLLAVDVSGDGGGSNPLLDEYRDLEVHPQAIDLRKEQHLEATKLLVSATTDQIVSDSDSTRPAENSLEEARAS